MGSPHDVATAYQDAATCYRKTNTQRAPIRAQRACDHAPSGSSAAPAPPKPRLRLMPPDLACAPTSAAEALRCYREVVLVHIDLGRFTSAAKVQKEIGEILEAEGDTAAALEELQKAADYYQAEESHSQANQVLLKVAGLAATTGDYARAIEIYEQVAISSLESSLLRFSVKTYLLQAGICRLATGEIGVAVNALERCAPRPARCGHPRHLPSQAARCTPARAGLPVPRAWILMYMYTACMRHYMHMHTRAGTRAWTRPLRRRARGPSSVRSSLPTRRSTRTPSQTCVFTDASYPRLPTRYVLLPTSSPARPVLVPCPSHAPTHTTHSARHVSVAGARVARRWYESTTRSRGWTCRRRRCCSRSKRR